MTRKKLYNIDTWTDGFRYLPSAAKLARMEVVVVPMLLPRVRG